MESCQEFIVKSTTVCKTECDNFVTDPVVVSKFQLLVELIELSVAEIKEELRFAIQNKRQFHKMSSTLDTVTVSERPVETSMMKTEFSPEEDERKKRRRERNKIAAAKCRNKKKEKTECLQKESEKLETINAELKAQIEELKNEKQHLIYMLNLHRPTCIVRAQNGRTPEDERNLFIQQIKEGTLQG
ncbi:hypothetical protein HGM15179_000965 [Zosterops borbonicus]|uniref:BZIP domain-containing protein n=1 Tax=Zosterops borbonicus TaxID=364589 RepID=A0A8K1GVD6_9PASS|nr:hypothetical protein HGM15179_000965 [Zosterops borbonicus]